MVRKGEKAPDERITEEKGNERIRRATQREPFKITGDIPDDTQTSTLKQAKKKVAKNRPFWTAVIVLLLSLIGTTVTIVLLVIDEGRRAGYGIATSLSISVTVLASIFLWHTWNDRRMRRRLFKQQTELELAELRLCSQRNGSSYPRTSLNHTMYSPHSEISSTTTIVPKRRSKVVGEGYEMHDMRRALGDSYNSKAPYPQRSDSQSWQDIMVANYIGDGKPLPPTPGTPEEEWDNYRHQRRQYQQHNEQPPQSPIFPTRPIHHPKPHRSRIPIPKCVYQLGTQSTASTNSALSTSSIIDNIHTAGINSGLTMMPPRIDSQFWRALNGDGAQPEPESPPPVPPKDYGTPTRSLALPKSMSAPSMSSPFHAAQNQPHLPADSVSINGSKSLSTFSLPIINSINTLPVYKIPRKSTSQIHVFPLLQATDDDAPISVNASTAPKLARKLTLGRPSSIIPITFKAARVTAVRGGDDIEKNMHKSEDRSSTFSAHKDSDGGEGRNIQRYEDEFQEIDLNGGNESGLSTPETVIRLPIRDSTGSSKSMQGNISANNIAEEYITEADKEGNTSTEAISRSLKVYEGT
ncbi:hypothetical protein AOQ84DRAFT_130353 [Glonium stellatum]|uniref:Uncharacterized protein n=1 Tax=Glonium stellatum TaxID=574774 RepID=A0A8E2F9E3_9PEZI|nr:hypothetical protein AOQ84DRAFT_130353 [Glonium stellatum]